MIVSRTKVPPFLTETNATQEIPPSHQGSFAISPAVSVVLCLGFLRSRLPGCLDTHGVRGLRHHHSSAFGCPLGIHAGIIDWGLGRWEMGRRAHAKDTSLRLFVIWLC